MKRRIAGFILAVCLLASAARAESLTLSVYAVTGDNQVEMPVAFDESFFENSSYEYNHRLMQTTMIVSQTGFATDAAYGADGDFDRERRARYACERLGFTDFRAWNFERALNDPSDKVAFSMGRRELESGYTLILIVMRSANYGAEWASNFHLGEGKTHAGFTKAAEGVIAGLDEYMDDLGIDGRVKIWITGYSRGAAVSNITAALLNKRARDSETPYANEDIFAYTFATPATALAYETAAEYELNGNIFNIISYADVVPEVPLGKWGYDRYGVTRVFGKLDERLTDAEARDKLKDVLEVYKRVTRTDMDLSAFRALRGQINSTIAGMYANVKDISEYVTEWEALYTRLMRVANTKVTRSSIDENTLNALKEAYAGEHWAEFALARYAALSSVEWTSDTFMALLSLYGEKCMRALSSVSSMTSLIEGAGDGIYDFGMVYMALSMMSAEEIAGAEGGNVYSRFSGYMPMLTTLLGLFRCFGGHMPEQYIAFLTALDEYELFGQTP